MKYILQNHVPYHSPGYTYISIRIYCHRIYWHKKVLIVRNEDEGWETAEALLLTVAELTSPVMAYQNWFINFYEFIKLFEWILSKVISPHFLCQLLIWRSINKICEQWELTFKTWSSSPRLSTLGKDFVFFVIIVPDFIEVLCRVTCSSKLLGSFFV